MVFVDGWMDGWMDGWTSKMERMVVEGERVKTRLNDAYRLFALRFQIRQISKSDRGRVIIYKVQILAVFNSRNHTFELLAIGACPKMMRQLVRTYTMW